MKISVKINTDVQKILKESGTTPKSQRIFGWWFFNRRKQKYEEEANTVKIDRNVLHKTVIKSINTKQSLERFREIIYLR